MFSRRKPIAPYLDWFKDGTDVEVMHWTSENNDILKWDPAVYNYVGLEGKRYPMLPEDHDAMHWSFVDCLRDWDNVCRDDIDLWVEAWHTHRPPFELREWLGLTEDQYARWLTDSSVIGEIVPPERAKRIWILRKGQWLSPNSLTDKPHPRAFFGGDEYGNKTLCLRFGTSVLVLNLAFPLSHELWKPGDDDA